MAYDLVIFDCDGVLVDSEPLSNRVFAACFQEIGIPITYDIAVRDYVGLSLDSCFAQVEQNYGRTIPDGFRETLQARTKAAMGEELQAVFGVRRIIDDLKSQNIPLCVASSGEIDKMQVSLGITGLWDKLAPHIFSAAEVERGKPHPDLFLYAAAQMGADPARCAVIEDSIYGVQAALAAGMRTFGYVGGEPAQALAQQGAVEFASMSELPDLLAADLT